MSSNGSTDLPERRATGKTNTWVKITDFQSSKNKIYCGVLCI